MEIENWFPENHIVVGVNRYGLTEKNDKILPFSAWFRKVAKTKIEKRENGDKRVAEVPSNAFNFKGTNEEKEYFLGRIFLSEIMREKFLGYTPGQIAFSGSFCREILSKPLLERLREHNSPIEMLYAFGGVKLLKEYGLQIPDNVENHEEICRKYGIPETCTPITNDEKNNVNRGIVAACNLWKTSFENTKRFPSYFKDGTDANNSYPTEEGIIAFGVACSMTGSIPYRSPLKFNSEYPVASFEILQVLTKKTSQNPDLAKQIIEDVQKGNLESIHSGSYNSNLESMLKGGNFSKSSSPLRDDVDYLAFYSSITEIQDKPARVNSADDNIYDYVKCCPYIWGAANKINSSLKACASYMGHSGMISAMIHGAIVEKSTLVPIVPKSGNKGVYMTGDETTFKIPVSTEVSQEPMDVSGVAPSHQYCSKLLKESMAGQKGASAIDRAIKNASREIEETSKSDEDEENDFNGAEQRTSIAVFKKSLLNFIDSDGFDKDAPVETVLHHIESFEPPVAESFIEQAKELLAFSINERMDGEKPTLVGIKDVIRSFASNDPTRHGRRANEIILESQCRKIVNGTDFENLSASNLEEAIDKYINENDPRLQHEENFKTLAGYVWHLSGKNDDPAELEAAVEKIFFRSHDYLKGITEDDFDNFMQSSQSSFSYLAETATPKVSSLDSVIGDGNKSAHDFVGDTREENAAALLSELEEEENMVKSTPHFEASLVYAPPSEANSNIPKSINPEIWEEMVASIESRGFDADEMVKKAKASLKEYSQSERLKARSVIHSVIGAMTKFLTPSESKSLTQYFTNTEEKKNQQNPIQEAPSAVGSQYMLGIDVEPTVKQKETKAPSVENK